jgi:hypothetical protein
MQIMISIILQPKLPPKIQKIKQNFTKGNDYITNDLLVSHSTKKALCKSSSINLTPNSGARYKRYQNIYNSLVRFSKKCTLQLTLYSLNIIQKHGNYYGKLLTETKLKFF